MASSARGRMNPVIQPRKRAAISNPVQFCSITSSNTHRNFRKSSSGRRRYRATEDGGFPFFTASSYRQLFAGPW